MAVAEARLSAQTAPRTPSRGPRFDVLEVKRFGTGVVIRSRLRGTVARDQARGTLEMSREQDGRELCDSGPVPWMAD